MAGAISVMPCRTCHCGAWTQGVSGINPGGVRHHLSAFPITSPPHAFGAHRLHPQGSLRTPPGLCSGEDLAFAIVCSPWAPLPLFNQQETCQGWGPGSPWEASDSGGLSCQLQAQPSLLPCLLAASAAASIKELIQFLRCASPFASCNARIDLEPGQPY